MDKVKEFFLIKAKKLKSLLMQLYNYYILYPKVSKEFKFQVMTNDETIETILQNKLSVSRYGDGELVLMNGSSIGFQHFDKNLAKRLKEVIQKQESGHLNCITDIMFVTDGLIRHSAMYCRSYVVREREALKKNIPANRKYGCTNFTRFYGDFVNKNKVLMQSKIDKIKMLWGGQMFILLKENIRVVA